MQARQVAATELWILYSPVPTYCLPQSYGESLTFPFFSSLSGCLGAEQVAMYRFGSGYLDGGNTCS